MISNPTCIIIMSYIIFKTVECCMPLPDLATYSWEDYKKMPSGYYRFPQKLMTYDEAVSGCQEDGAQLVSFQSDNELSNILRELIGSDKTSAYSPIYFDFWVGAKRDGDKYVYLDGGEIDMDNGPVPWFSSSDAGATLGQNNRSIVLAWIRNMGSPNADEYINITTQYRTRSGDKDFSMLRSLVEEIDTGSKMQLIESYFQENENPYLTNQSNFQLENDNKTKTLLRSIVTRRSDSLETQLLYSYLDYIDDSTVLWLLMNFLKDTMLEEDYILSREGDGDGDGDGDAPGDCLFFICFAQGDFGYVSENCSEQHFMMCKKEREDDNSNSTDSTACPSANLATLVIYTTVLRTTWTILSPDYNCFDAFFNILVFLATIGHALEKHFHSFLIKIQNNFSFKITQVSFQLALIFFIIVLIIYQNKHLSINTT